MSILYNKKATLFSYSRNSKNVATYSEEWTLFACNVQPVNTKDWFEWVALLKTRKMYSDKKVRVWDKIIIDWITYIVDSIESRDWTKRKFYKSFIVESNWN